MEDFTGHLSSHFEQFSVDKEMASGSSERGESTVCISGDAYIIGVIGRESSKYLVCHDLLIKKEYTFSVL